MNTLSVGENREELTDLLNLLETVDPRGEHWPSLAAKRCRMFLERYEVDTVFLNAKVSDADGVSLGRELAQKYPRLNIVFLAENENLAYEAFQFYASAYLKKPFTEESIREAVSHLRNEVVIEALPVVQVQCFGDFEVFVKGIPLKFKRSRTKELFAVLICHRGAALSMGKLMAVLWEDGGDTKSDRSYLRMLISDLKQTFASVQADDIIQKGYNTIGLDTSKVECDYYDFLRGKRSAVFSYQGEFMSQYSWAEYEFSHDEYIE